MTFGIPSPTCSRRDADAANRRCYAAGMELRAGKIVNDQVVLDDELDLEEGSRVRVWVGDPEQPVTVADEELELIREGQAAAERGDLIDARAFLRELRRTG